MLFAVERILFSLKALFNFFTVSTQEVGQLQNGHGNSSHESSGIKLLLTSNQRLPDESVREMFSYTARRNKKTNHSSSSERYNGIMIAWRWGGSSTPCNEVYGEGQLERGVFLCSQPGAIGLQEKQLKGCVDI